MKVLMIGAAGGNVGLVLPALVKRGVAVRALVRDEQRAEAARRLGATDAVIADLVDPGSLRVAVAGVDGVFHVNPAFAPREAEMGVAMVDAAKAAGVRSYGTFELCAPGMVDRVQMAAMISEELGRRINAEETPQQQWASQLPAGPVREGLTRMMAH